MAHVAVGSPEPPPASGSLCPEPARSVWGEAKGPVGPEAGWPHANSPVPACLLCVSDHSLGLGVHGCQLMS